MRIIRSQEETLNQVSLPILRVWEGVLVMLLTGFGGFPQAQVLASLERIAREVLPRLVTA